MNLKDEFIDWVFKNANPNLSSLTTATLSKNIDESNQFFDRDIMNVEESNYMKMIDFLKEELYKTNTAFQKYNASVSSGRPRALLGKENYLKFLEEKFDPKTKKNRNYWVFQGSPDIYDIERALKAGHLKSWKVAAHKETIQPGDNVILWQTGTNAGCYALAEVVSEVGGVIEEDEDEKQYYKILNKEDSVQRVQIKITKNLVDNPVLWEEIKELPEFQNFKAGNQGTNFTATREEYETLMELGNPSSISQYARVKRSLDKDKVEKFLEILRRYVKEKNIEPGDPRLAFNVRPSKNGLVFLIGMRYALSIYKTKNIFNFSFIAPEKISPENGGFINKKGEIETYWNVVDEIAGYEDKVKEGFDVELARNYKSPFRRFSNKDFINDVYNSNDIMKKIHLNGNSVYKLSMGKFLKAPELRQHQLVEYFEENSIGVMDGETKKGQGKKFREEIKPNDIVYITYGQEKLGNLCRVVGEVVGLNDDINEKLGSTTHLARRLEVITNPLINHTRSLTNDRRDWLPSGNSTLFPIPDIQEANELLFEPFYGVSFKHDDIDRPGPKSKISNPTLNTILYGPPGTGKTFQLQDSYFKEFTVQETSLNREQYLENIVSDLKWWQVAALILLDLKRARVPEIVSHELLQIKTKLSKSKNPNAIIWGYLQHYTDPDCEYVKVADRSSNPVFFKDQNSNWEVKEDLLEQFYPEAYTILEEVKHYQPNPDKLIKNYEFVTFHQSFSYEDFIEGIKPNLDEEESTVSYRIEDGIFKKMCLKADADRENRYALFIDEINRGNVSAIFGELITLIEDDKRLGEENELRVKLPYSKTELGVPPNLHIFGTMNTADRSVEALDTALRRRFVFEEIMPRPELLKDINFEGFNLKELLSTINERIEALLDRDHTIGHSYFIKIKSGDTVTLQKAFENKIIPLLQEYFYHDYEKIALILGKGFIERKDAKLKFASFSKVEPPEVLASYHLREVEDIEAAVQILLNRKDEAGE